MTHKSGLIKTSAVSIKARKVKQRKGNPNNFIDETGQRYGRLIVIRSDGIYKNNEVTWQCQCDCGKIVNHVRGISLRRKATKSCGCLHNEQLAERNRQQTNPNKEKYQKLAQQMRSAGASYGTISRHFTEQNIPSLRGGKWYPSTIKWLIG